MARLSGRGTKHQPYQIKRLDDLLYINNIEGKYYELADDIDCHNKHMYPALYLKLGSVFDGKGHTIKNIVITPDKFTKCDAFGLFRLCSGVIRNLNLENIKVRVPENHEEEYSVGIITSKNQGVIENCNIINSSIECSGRKTGGVVGSNKLSAEIINCQFEGEIEADNTTGGIVGSNQGIVEDCHSDCKIVSPDDVGGIAGENRGGEITNCHSDFYIIGRTSVGGLIGHNTSRSTLNSSSCSGFISGVKNVGGIVGANLGEVSETGSEAYISSYNTINVGGVAGKNEKEINFCHFNGIIDEKTPKSMFDYVGVLVGYNRGEISDCCVLRNSPYLLIGRNHGRYDNICSKKVEEDVTENIMIKKL